MATQRGVWSKWPLTHPREFPARPVRSQGNRRNVDSTQSTFERTTPMIARIGRWCFVHRRATLLTWIVVLLGMGAIGNAIVGPAFSSKMEIPASESASGFDVLNQYFPGQGAGGRSGTIVFKAEQGVDDPEVVAAMTDLFDSVGTIEGVTVISPYDESGVRQINPDGTIAYATVNLDQSLGQNEMSDVGAQIIDQLPEDRRTPGGDRWSDAGQVPAARVRTHRPRLRHHRADPGVRLRAGHGSAHRHRPVRRRRRLQPRRAVQQLDGRARLRHHARRHARVSPSASTTRCSSSPATARTCAPARASRTLRSAPWTLPAARWCSPA